MANQAYFQDAIKRSGVKGGPDAAWLEKDFKKKTQGLDQDLAMEALSGGRMWGESGQKRYDELVKKRSEAKSRAQQQQANSSSGKGNTTNSSSGAQATTNSTKSVSDSLNNNLNQEVDTSMEQNVNQDNDINTNINGNNNYTNIAQDNSIRQYGGDTRVFNYQSTGDARLDSPVSAATMGGFYDVDDSPAKQAKFQDMYSTMNRDAQKKYQDTSSISAGAIARARLNESLDVNAMDKRIKDRENYSRAKSETMGMNLFGDMYKGSGPSWSQPTPQKPFETPDFEKMYEKYSNF